MKYNKVYISKAVIDSYINHNELISVNDVLREYNEMKIEVYCVSCKKNTATENSSVKELNKID